MAVAKTAKAAIRELKKLADPIRAKESLRYFKVGPGMYGEGDKFLGLTVPNVRRIARAFRELPTREVDELLQGSWHEARLCALVIMRHQYEKGDEATRAKVVRHYLRRLKYVNNWDLVDSSAPYILGPYTVAAGDTEVLDRLATSPVLWRRRVAVLATAAWIRIGNHALTMKYAEQLLGDKEDLMHKAVGWMLREVGKQDVGKLEAFIKKHGTRMPRTMLRYAIEKLPKSRRDYWLASTR
jgi:3-methyladenine DNA glycosylase AlkD